MSEPSKAPLRMRGQSTARVTNQGAPQEQRRRHPKATPLPPEEPPPQSRREELVEGLAASLRAMLDQARQQRTPSVEQSIDWVVSLLDAAVEVVDDHFRERAERNLAARRAASTPPAPRPGPGEAADLPPLPEATQP